MFWVLKCFCIKKKTKTIHCAVLPAVRWRHTQIHLIKKYKYGIIYSQTLIVSIKTEEIRSNKWQQCSNNYKYCNYSSSIYSLSLIWSLGHISTQTALSGLKSHTHSYFYQALDLQSKQLLLLSLDTSWKLHSDTNRVVSWCIWRQRTGCQSP